MRNLTIVISVVLAMFLFSGCASTTGYVSADMLVKNNQVKGIKVTSGYGKKTNYTGISGYQHENNVHYKCGMKIRLHAVAKGEES